MSNIVELKCSELILDYNLYPRHKIDSTHVGHIMAAYRSGYELPPVVADKKSRRATDGFHRVTAKQRLVGPDATIMVELRPYGSEAEMLLDAIRMNSGHGTNLTPYDRVRCITLADEFKISAADMAEALRTPVDELEEMRIRRTATTRDGKVTPIKQGIGHLAGRRITRKQERGNESYGGLRPLFYVNQVILLVEHDLVAPDDVNCWGRLEYLRNLLDEAAPALRVESA